MKAFLQIAYSLALLVLAEGIVFPVATFFGVRNSPLSVTIPLVIAAILAGIAMRIAGKESRRIAATLAALLVLAVTSAFATHRVWHSRFLAMKADLRAKGYRMSVADYWEDLPDDQYLYPAMEKTFTDLNTRSFNNEKHPGLSVGPWTPQTLKAESESSAPRAKEIRETIAPKLGKVTRLLKVDVSAYKNDPVGAPIPRMANFIYVGKVLSLDAVSNAYKGNEKAAWDDVRVLLRLDALTSHESTLIGHMISVALRKLVEKTVLNIGLRRPAAKPPEDIEAALKSFIADREVETAFKREVAFQMDLHDFLESAPSRKFVAYVDEPNPFINVFVSWMRACGTVDMYALRFTPAYIFTDPWPSGWAQVKDHHPSMDDLPAWPYFLYAGATPKFGNLYAREWEERTWAQLALVASALRRHKAKHGALPAQLADLAADGVAPELLNDAFAGAPFQYAPAPGKAGQYVLSSVGPEHTSKDSQGDAMSVPVS